MVATSEETQLHSVLAQLSLGYSQLEGRLSTHYSPVCHCTCPLAGTFPFDLHVLCTPRAFILSQDQTLQLNLLPSALEGRRQISDNQSCSAMRSDYKKYQDWPERAGTHDSVIKDR